MPVAVVPSGLEARVRSLRVQQQQAERGVAGQRCALNLTGPKVGKDAIRRGDWVTAVPAQAATDRLDGTMLLLASEAQPLRHWTPVHLHLAAAHVPARVALLRGEPIRPGGDGLIQLVLDQPIGALWGDRFVLRDASAQRTIGGGQVLDPSPPRRRRRTPERLAVLAALSDPDLDCAIGAAARARAWPRRSRCICARSQPHRGRAGGTGAPALAASVAGRRTDIRRGAGDLGAHP